MGHTMVHSPGYLLVYAGYSLIHGMLGDILSFNLSANAWSHVEVNQVPGRVPSSRYLHSAVFHVVSNGRTDCVSWQHTGIVVIMFDF